MARRNITTRAFASIAAIFIAAVAVTIVATNAGFMLTTRTELEPFESGDGILRQPPSTSAPQSITGSSLTGKMTINVPAEPELIYDFAAQYKLNKTASHPTDTDVLMSQPVRVNFGKDNWSSKFNADYNSVINDNILSNTALKKTDTNFMMAYPNKYTLSGEFKYPGPMPANSHIDDDMFANK